MKRLENLINKVKVKGRRALAIGASLLIPFTYTACFPPEPEDETNENKKDKTEITEADILTVAGALGMQSPNSNDAKLGSLAYLLGNLLHEKETAKEGRNQIIIYNVPQKQKALPENVYMNEGRYYPAPGYTWINPQSQTDLKVKKIEKNVDISTLPLPSFQNQRQKRDNKNKHKTNLVYNNMYVGIFGFNDWNDLIKDGIPTSKNEFSGLGKTTFKLNENIGIVAYYPGYRGIIDFRIYNRDEKKLVGKVKRYSRGEPITLKSSKFPELSPKKTLLDKVKDQGPGQYRIFSETKTNDLYFLDITITE